MKNGKKIKLLRIQNEMKAINLCKLADLTPTKLSLIENCHIECSEDLYMKLIDLIKKHS